jgi:anti-sigma factor RsiW
MTCDQLEIWISTYQDGELDPRRRRLVEEHLAGCSACRALSDELAALAGALRAGLERWDPPETLHTRVMRRIPEPASAPAGGRAPRGWLSFGLVPAGIMAAWLLMAKPPAGGPDHPVRNATPPSVQVAAPPPLVGEPEPTAPSTAQQATKGGVTPAATPHNPAATQHPAVGQPNAASHKVNPGPMTGSHVRGARRAPRTETELDALRRLLRLRRPRWQDRMVREPRRRPRVHMVQLPAPALPVQPKRAGSSPPRITVVDYVLPEVPPTAVEPGSKSKTEFVLRAAEPYQVSQASLDY